VSKEAVQEDTGRGEDRSAHPSGARARTRRKTLLILLLGGIACVLSIPGAAVMMKRSARDRTYQDPDAIPFRRVGLVLGCAKHLSNGRENLFFRNRISAAAQLFAAGKVDFLLVSGDNHVAGHDEPTDMKDSLIASGVPGERIYCDYAGLRTFDSVVRAREIFGQSKLTVISQESHNQRAIFIAGHKGVDAIGFNAEAVSGYSSFRTECREQLARVKTVMDIYLLRTEPKFLGEEVPIGLGEPTKTRREHED